ncbi:MAG: hypothetical protein IPO21_00875 [Bacteroidales bacterium]|nr:hypothetical protein [Bacteroidales bacterium]
MQIYLLCKIDSTSAILNPVIAEIFSFDKLLACRLSTKLVIFASAASLSKIALASFSFASASFFIAASFSAEISSIFF